VARLREFHSQNGLYLSIAHGLDEAISKLRSASVGSSLGNPRGFRLGHGWRILGASRVQVGSGFEAGTHLWLEAIASSDATAKRQLVIGDRVTVGDSVRISAVSSVEIGDDVLMGSRIYIADHNHGSYSGTEHSHPGISPHRRPLRGDAVVIGHRVWIGEGVTVLAGARIGNGSIVGANSVVTGTLPEDSIAAGVPARVLKQYDRSTNRWERSPDTS
jgi:lipopolysaccharide O-acetyltransferase